MDVSRTARCGSTVMAAATGALASYDGSTLLYEPRSHSFIRATLITSRAVTLYKTMRTHSL